MFFKGDICNSIATLNAKILYEMRFLHIIASFFGLPQSWRNWMVAHWKIWTHWKPKWYCRANAWGVYEGVRDVKITVSLTSYPGRIGTVHETINTLLTQTIKPDRVVLWLAESQFPKREKELPRNLLRLMRFGLTIDWCEDIRSFKKLIPSLRKYPGDLIITVDDDILYDSTMVERLLESYAKDSNSIHSQLTMKIGYLGEEKFSPYNKWKFDDKFDSSYLNLLMGGTGTLYPPGSIPGEVFNAEVFQSIAPTVDDIWFWAMATLNGWRVRHIVDGYEMHFVQNPRANMAQALWNTNIDSSAGNDAQLSAIIKRYPDILERLNS